MAEPYSDEELLAQTIASPADGRLLATVARLQRERDEARRVAKDAAVLVRKHVIWELMTHVERCRVERAEAYSEVQNG